MESKEGIRRLLVSGVVLATMAWTPQAAAQEFHGHASLAPTLGQSVFSSESSRAALRYEGGVEFGVGGFEAGLLVGAAQWLAHPQRDGPLSFEVGDTRLSVAQKFAFGDRVAFAPVLHFVLPTSRNSRDATLVTAVHPGVRSSVTIEDLRFSVTILGRKDFHRATAPVISPGRLDEVAPPPGPFGFRTAGSRLPGREYIPTTAVGAGFGDGLVLTGGTNVEYGLHVGAELDYGLPADFFVGVAIGHSWAWTYPREPDPFLPEAVEPAKRGNARTLVTNFGVGWVRSVASTEFTIRLGGYTAQAPRTPDNDSARFPFWNITDASTDASVVELRVTARW